jgi:hypothetical protein
VDKWTNGEPCSCFGVLMIFGDGKLNMKIWWMFLENGCTMEKIKDQKCEKLNTISLYLEIVGM